MKIVFAVSIFLSGCVTTAQVATAPMDKAASRVPSASKDETCFGKVEEIGAIVIPGASLSKINDAVNFCSTKISQAKNLKLLGQLIRRCDGDYQAGQDDLNQLLIASCHLKAVEYVKSLPGEPESWTENKLIIEPAPVQK